jgi:regulator of PEP synthase PpsR (kinase-PPPase family)
LFIVSDSTGDTATRVTRAALRQFEDAKVPVQVFPNVMDRESIERIFKQAALQRAFVVTSLVSADHRAFAHELARAYRLLSVDVIGALITGLSGWLGEAPQGRPGLLHVTDAEYFKRIEAVEFTVKLDDGKDPRLLRQADIVLVGVSRTSKTPLSVFLAYKGLKVANVPIVLDHQPPKELYDVDPRRVVALTIDPESLQQIRRQRLRTMRVRDASSYDNIDHILSELEYAEELFRRNRQWPLINVTNRAVEETAGMILHHLESIGVVNEKREVGQL